MENNHEHNEFRYIYSAKEQEEVKRIREKYTTHEEDKMERLRRLDNSVTQKAQVVSLVFGVVGILLLGFGMSLIMTDLSVFFGLYGNVAMAIGILIGVAGGILTCLAYPMYHFVANRARKKIAPEIIKLTDELMK